MDVPLIYFILFIFYLFFILLCYKIEAQEPSTQKRSKLNFNINNPNYKKNTKRLINFICHLTTACFGRMHHHQVV
jgi:hypothetical protein